MRGSLESLTVGLWFRVQEGVACVVGSALRLPSGTPSASVLLNAKPVAKEFRGARGIGFRV